jgi:hypothetical protein
VKLRLLVEKKLDESLVRLKLLVEEEMVELLVKLGLDLEEEKNFPQLDLSKFLLQLASKG